jgi:hypothetical protein
VLRATERAPTLSPSVVFTFGIVVEFIKELGGASQKHQTRRKKVKGEGLDLKTFQFVKILVLIHGEGCGITNITIGQLVVLVLST